MARFRWSGWAIVAALLLSVTLAGPARAQTPPVGDPVTPSGLQLSADQFGVGNVARAGGWIGVRVRFRDDAAQPRDVILEIVMRDADGDSPVYRRVVTANPGRWQQAWLYVFLPYQFDPTRGLQLRAREVSGDSAATAVEEGAGGEEGARRGRLLAETVARPSQLLQDYEGMLGIMGGATHGLSLYASSMSGNSFSPLAHERTEIVSIQSPLDLPDRWMGLAPLETLVWSSGDPSELGADRARAIREWVERGGHLVIVMTVQGQSAWTSGGNNLLHDLFPAAEVRVREGVNLAAYRSLITREPASQQGLPSSAIVHTFEPMASAGDEEAMRVLDGPDGECVVVRRLVGQGMVTAVGMGVGSPELSTVGLPMADVFWNRVLGWRGQFETLTRLNQLATVPGMNLGNRDNPIVLDRAIDSRINLTGESLAGLVLAFALFGLYWLVAGPGGFAVLKKTGNQRHAWVGFVGAAGLFTAIAWGGATIIKPQQLRVKHVTVLDHVYGQEVDRARSWLSVLVPSYQGAEVSVDQEAGSGLVRFHQMIAPWEVRPDASLGGGATGASFPDARAYQVESREPSTLRVPTRATVKQFEVEWAGSPRYGWPSPVGAGGAGTIALDPASGLPVGVLTHDMPAALRDVWIIVVRGQATIPVWRTSDWVGQDRLARVLGESRTFNVVAMSASLDGEWAPGQALNLHAIFESIKPADRPIDQRLARLSEGLSLDAGLRFATLFHQLGPPDFGSGGSAARYERIGTHGLDMSRWMSQPCVIVLGTLEMEGTDALPVPMGVRVGGEDRTLRAEGTTLVRWVYPLPPAPPAWATSALQDPGADAGEESDPRGVPTGPLVPPRRSGGRSPG